MNNGFFPEKKRQWRIRGWTHKGSSTMEYVIIIAVGALFASLLYMTMSDGEGLIQSALEKKVLEVIQGQLPEEDVPFGNISETNGPLDLGNAPALGEFIGGNPVVGGFPDVHIPSD